jgi:Domain of Unknown Function with PDB structure (DUF3857)/Transglutaminase-like superfamily
MISKYFCSLRLWQQPSKLTRDRLPIALAVAGLVGVLMLYSSTARGADAPAWMHALSNAPLPPHDEKTDAVVLYTEEILTVQPNGKMREVDRAAYKILRPGGRYLGQRHFYFDSETRITEIHGWCIPAQGKDYEVKEKDLTERGMVDREGGILFTDDRAKVMEIPAPDPGNIIGFEVTHEVRPYILQDEWPFQETLPVADARYTLLIPPGWEYKAVWVNHPELSPTSMGNNQWHWELKNIPEIKREEKMPPWTGVAGLMIVALIPPGGSNHGFLNWSEMGSWYGGLLRDRKDATPEIKQKVVELTSKSNDPLEKMRALAQFMQKDIRYVGIELGIGGWQPHPARDVFAKRYGDCKDKATLLSTMLKEIGIDSYHLVIHTHRGAVTPALPPHVGAFNHAILAIRLPDSVNDSSLTATIQYPGLGRLLIFDPTDEVTPFGTLRGELQSNFALLVTPDGGNLVQLPQLPATTSGVSRGAKLKLDTNGTLSGEVTEVLRGDSATQQREFMRYVNKDADRIKPIETELSHSLGNFLITKATVGDLTINDRPLQYNYTFVSEAFAKNAGNMILVRPRVLGNWSSDILERKEPRKYPVEFEGPLRSTDSYLIEVPAGFELDDLPLPVEANFSFGSYHSKSEWKGNALLYTRTLEIKELSVPVDKLDQLKKFYRIIATDERTTAVLKPKGN